MGTNGSAAHETRLQKTEEKILNLSTELAVNTTRLTSLEETVKSGFEQVNRKLDENVTPIMVDLHSRMGRVEEEQSQERSRTQLKKKTHQRLFWILVTAFSGILAEKGLWLLHSFFSH